MLSAHLQGQPDHDFPHVVIADDLLQMSKITPLVLSLQCFQPLGGDAQWVRDGQAHTLRSVVNRQNTVWNQHFAIIGAGDHGSLRVSPTGEAAIFSEERILTLQKWRQSVS
jgi:hypothetical protein